MKTILILRHGKSDWGDPGLNDFDRPLAKRGQDEAPRMGAVLAAFDHMPDIILSSPARRARQTAEAVAKTCGYNREIQWQESFYGYGSQETIAVLQQLPKNVERVLVIGHNPTLEETVAHLCASSAPEIDDDIEESWLIKLPTAGLVCLNININDWADLAPGTAVLQWFLIPKLVKALQSSK
jgi:phosphohistidine phosphatase